MSPGGRLQSYSCAGFWVASAPGVSEVAWGIVAPGCALVDVAWGLVPVG